MVVDLDGGAVEPGDVLRYEIRVRNTGSDSTMGLRVTDPTPTWATFVADSLVVAGESVAGATNPLASSLAVGELGVGEELVLFFDVRVDADAPFGALVANSAIASDEAGAVARSDDPTTPELDDPTTVVVGDAADLSRTRKLVVLGDENGDGFAQIGETLRYTVQVPNRGAATAEEVFFVDDLPSNTRFVEGTLTVNGAQQTDVADDDLGEVTDGVVRVLVGTVPSGRVAEIGFDVLVMSGTVVANQGGVSSSIGFELTDDDGNPANGDQPTVTPLDGLERGLQLSTYVAPPAH